MSATLPSAQEQALRLHIYRFWCERGRAPTTGESARALNIPPDAARAIRQRLHDAHLILLEPDGERIRMANPLSAVATGFRARVDGVWLHANCAWDAPGIPAMLGCDAEIEAYYSPCDEPVAFRVRAGDLQAPKALVHFALPFRRWYDDLVET